MLINKLFLTKKSIFYNNKQNQTKKITIIKIFLVNPSINYVQFINNYQNQQPSSLGQTMS